jgi:peroxiredoxin Q/BCP
MIAPSQPFPPFPFPTRTGSLFPSAISQAAGLSCMSTPRTIRQDVQRRVRDLRQPKRSWIARTLPSWVLNQDAVDSHKQFCEKSQFAIDLLSDTTGELLRRLGVSQSEWYGTLYWDRTTLVVDPEGIVRKALYMISDRVTFWLARAA